MGEPRNVVLSVELRIKQDRIQDFLDAIAPAIEGAREKEEGCLEYTVAQSNDAPEIFRIHEVYRDEPALEAHRESPHFLAWSAVADSLLAADGRKVWRGSVVPLDNRCGNVLEMGPGQVWRAEAAEWISRGNGVRSRPLCGPDFGASSLLTGMTEIPVGGEIPLHHHNTDEFIQVLAGRARVTIDGVDQLVESGDSTFVLPGIKHRYVNTGEEALRILWVYGDINTTRTIAATGVTLGHLDRYDA